MPYIDLQYAKRLLQESRDGLEHSDESREASRAVPETGCAFGESGKPAGKARVRRARLDDAIFEREPVCAEYSEEQSRAFEKVKRLALVRERGSRELVERLVRDGFDREDAQCAVTRATDCGLVDDVRYGAVLARSRISRGRGRYGIEQELERSGIAATDIPGWPEEFFSQSASDPFREDDSECDGTMVGGFGGAGSDEPEIQRALALLRRKPPRAKNMQASSYRKLIAKGYSSSVAQAATRRFLEEN